ncbi:type II toxin-antitoxin system RelE/ParE family toxin [Campylobacter gastrosuis]|uniref:Type II toxin-antitoxin system RelE/ParE family toxin n=1 Tax=Campylobacter gastrosuis TaxID=2974576 RepID=A0ABT7HTH0_9BACT|nr:type II toxin-antitoxin system RelE/ParE family toxin [Campylobacter gastrosuis]MDL0090047.1 type II toxin-antitoxin system RelE/ParE family toxin [Campylobacter gastrosuis]
MNIIFRDDFLNELDNILEFIAADSTNRAIKFADELYDKIYNLQNMPYKFRQSTSFKSNNIRDLIFKGYVVPYLIDDENIVILGIFKENIIF